LNDSLFRRESGRLVSALTRIFGVHNLQLAEDVAQEALVRAFEVWKLRGVPENPSAWLVAVAKNLALDVLRRQRTALSLAPDLENLLQTEWTVASVVNEQFEPKNIGDDLLRMMFTCARPKLSENVQVALVLQVLCGFSVREVAQAFLSEEAAMEKKLVRAKATLAESDGFFELLQGPALVKRLAGVQRALYLLFNEGYHGASTASAVRVELCEEAMRLTSLLLAHPLTTTPRTSALAALMCFNAARLPGRVDDAGELLQLADQDRSKWNSALIAEGERLLEQSASGPELSEYHVEAAIAGVHSRAKTANATQWNQIVALYDALMALRPSPVIELNRAVAIAQHEGPGAGIAALNAIENRERLDAYPFFPAAYGELELRRGQHEIAAEHFQRALTLARSPEERRFFERRIAHCKNPSPMGRGSAKRG